MPTFPMIVQEHQSVCANHEEGTSNPIALKATAGPG